MNNQTDAALLSVHDRHGIVDLGRALAARGLTIYATGGTRTYLAEYGIEARDVGELTGYPPLFDGRVKTLHPAVFGGILADRANGEHIAQAEKHKIPRIAVVAVNLYPFEATVAREGVTPAEAVEQIDIGGVSLIRAAAKNHAHVTVLTDTAQYARVIEGEPDLQTRREFAAQAFTRTAAYDAAISKYLSAQAQAQSAMSAPTSVPTGGTANVTSVNAEAAEHAAHGGTSGNTEHTGVPGPSGAPGNAEHTRPLPGSLILTLPIAKALRYGENPQSSAAFYLPDGEHLPEQLHGKELSYNNLLDLDGTLRLLVRSPRGIDEPIGSGRVRAAIVKHTVPCGVAEADSVVAAVAAALASDPVSAFGGIVAVDAKIDLAAAEKLSDFFLEIVAAPEFDDDALERLRKKKNLRILRFAPGLPERLRSELRVRTALRGILAEDDDPKAAPEKWRVVSKRMPTPSEWTDLTLAWDIVRHVKSNGIVVVRDQATRGICAGQTNRVSAVRIAAFRAGTFAAGAACASDGFFPFADGLETAASYGCTAILAPEGSIRDAEVIESADRLKVSLVFSSRRYFLH